VTLTSTAPGSIHAFVDETGSLCAGAQEIHDLPSGVVVVTVRPGIRRTTWIATDIVARMGKTVGIIDSERAANHGLAYARAWLVAEEISDLVVAHAQWLLPPTWWT